MTYNKFALYFVNEDQTICGSDSYIPFDGRYSITTCIIQAITHYNKHLDSFKEQVIGFRICTGSILKPKYLTNLIRINNGKSV